MGAYAFDIEPGHVLAFARAVGDEQLAHEVPAPGTPVPATFPAAAVQFDPTHMQGLRPSGALAADSSTAGGSVLHAEQEFEYFAPLHVGDSLTVTEYDGASWRKQSSRAGTLTFHEIVRDYHDSAGDLVLRSRMVLVDTELAVSGAGGP
ncbi:FAS1-like dehydratase domain-containing protein [Mycobacterium marseillense]|uniref:FAS1-like dehydratase domain-containing protein n=1 Tax=Mycobacterium marseillense TaxID=701042 RepID=UPI0011A45470|nr:MaoC family dehydratase N-terminal domain-containing protein [Mycobacterium marseillense]